MIIVLDASAAVRSVIDPANSHWSKPLSEADLVIAPELFVAEVSNTFWKYCHNGELHRSRCESLLISALGLVDEYRPMPELAAEVFDLCVTTSKAAYDFYYLVLARRNSAMLLTADRTLHQLAEKLRVKVAPPG